MEDQSLSSSCCSCSVFHYSNRKAPGTSVATWSEVWISGNINPLDLEKIHLNKYRDSYRWALKISLDVLSKALTYVTVQATRTQESHLHNTVLKGHSFSIDFTVTFLKTYLKIIIHSQDLENVIERSPCKLHLYLFLIGFLKIITSCGDNYSCCWVLACDNRCILAPTTPKTWEVALDWCVVMSFLCISRISWSHVIKAYVRKHHPFMSGLRLSVHRYINC